MGLIYRWAPASWTLVPSKWHLAQAPKSRKRMSHWIKANELVSIGSPHFPTAVRITVATPQRYYKHDYWRSLRWSHALPKILLLFLQTNNAFLSPPYAHHRRRSSVMFSDMILLHGNSVNSSSGSNLAGPEKNNICSSEKMTQTDGNVWLTQQVNSSQVKRI